MCTTETETVQVRQRSNSGLSTHPFEKIPDHMKDNPHIHHGYRVNYTFLESLMSLFTVHNELINVWTHLVAFFYFAYLAWWNYLEGIAHPEDTVSSLRMVISMYCAFGCFTFLFSSVFHLLVSMEKDVALIFAKLDYSGIVIQILGSFFSGLHVAFYCEEDTSVWYSVGIAVLCALGLVVMFTETFSKPRYQNLRVGVFAAIIAYSLLPLAHLLWTHGLYGEEITFLVSGFLLMLLVYGMGAYIYASQWPESVYPGRFDIVGASHQLWHLFGVAAAMIHYWTLERYLNYRHVYGCAHHL
eukprot:GFYU01003521.1.p1 GENE.GFYU01003521.1~~GFYU01003521.1.p1  ORF type:complete len:299 (+),score=39.47 GFYU01003521.1:126-1022(+)